MSLSLNLSLGVTYIIAEKLEKALQIIVSSWHEFKRDFPWRKEEDPWKILLAEILLIQTDAAKVLAAYQKIVECLPNPEATLKIGENAIAELLRPLGLYKQRASTLIKAAKFIKEKHGGKVPIRYQELKEVPGIGEYAAAAMAIYFGEQAPILDVNIARLLSRMVFGRDPPKRYMYDTELRALTSQIPWTRTLLYAVLDFAAQVCTARKPKCVKCPVIKYCSYKKAEL